MNELDLRRSYSEQISVFNAISPGDVYDILSRGKMFLFKASQEISHEGTLDTAIFIVLDVVVDILCKNEFIGKRQSVDAFDKMSVLNHRKRYASVAANSDVKVFTHAESESNLVPEKSCRVNLLEHYSRAERAHGICKPVQCGASPYSDGIGQQTRCEAIPDNWAKRSIVDAKCPTPIAMW